MTKVNLRNCSTVIAKITWRVKGGIAEYCVNGVCVATMNNSGEKIIEFQNRELETVMSISPDQIEFIKVDFNETP